MERKQMKVWAMTIIIVGFLIAVLNIAWLAKCEPGYVVITGPWIKPVCVAGYLPK